MKKLLLAALFLSQSAFAGQYAEQLSQCVYNNLNSQDKKVLTQWAFVTLGKTKAAKEITVIPASKIKAVDDKAKQTISSLVTQKCGKELAKVALHEKSAGLKEAGANLALKLAQDELKGKYENIFPSLNLSDQGTMNVMKAGEILDGFFKKMR